MDSADLLLLIILDTGIGAFKGEIDVEEWIILD